MAFSGAPGPLPQFSATCGDSAARPGSCHKSPGALYVQVEGGAVLPLHRADSLRDCRPSRIRPPRPLAPRSEPPVDERCPCDGGAEEVQARLHRGNARRLPRALRRRPDRPRGTRGLHPRRAGHEAFGHRSRIATSPDSATPACEFLRGPVSSNPWPRDHESGGPDADSSRPRARLIEGAGQTAGPGGLVADGERVVPAGEAAVLLCRLTPHSTACRWRWEVGSNAGGPLADPRSGRQGSDWRGADPTIHGCRRRTVPSIRRRPRSYA